MSDNKNADARAILADWQDARGGKPLANASAGYPVDRCSTLLTNAAAILSMLSLACEDSGTLIENNLSGEFHNTTGRMMAGALDGVGDLVSLAAFLMED